METAPTVTLAHDALCRELQLRHSRLSPAHLFGFSVNGTPLRESLLCLLQRNAEDMLALLDRQTDAVRMRCRDSSADDPSFSEKAEASRAAYDGERERILHAMDSLAVLRAHAPSPEEYFPEPDVQMAQSV